MQGLGCRRRTVCTVVVCMVFFRPFQASLRFYTLYSIIALAIRGPKAEPIATPSVILFISVICNIYRTRKRSLPRYQNTEKCVEKRGRRPRFLTTSRCFETVVKNYFEFFI